MVDERGGTSRPDLSGAWIDRVQACKPQTTIVLDMDSISGECHCAADPNVAACEIIAQLRFAAAVEQELRMPRASAHAKRQTPFAPALIALATALTSLPARADPACASITAPVLEIAVVDCTQVWPQLQASRQFPDVFAGSGKKTNLCYMSTGPATAFIGDTQVTIASTLSGWTTDFTPVLFGGTDNLGTVVTQLTVADLDGKSVAELFTRDTIDLSQIFTTGTSSEEDVIVGGGAALHGAKGTYRITATPEDPGATKVKLTNLTGVICANMTIAE